MFPQPSRYSLVYPAMLLNLITPKLKEVRNSQHDEKERISLVSVRMVSGIDDPRTDETRPRSPRVPLPKKRWGQRRSWMK